MDIREFTLNALEQVRDSSEMSQTDYDQELARFILDYMEDTGEVNAPEICSFRKTRARITAYDYNDEAESLDLFYLIKADTILGKVNNAKVQQSFNYLMSFYHGAMNDTLTHSINVEKHDEIEEVAKLIQSTKGKINQLRLYVITDGVTDPSAVPDSSESEDFIVEYNVWDMQRVFQQNTVRSGKEKVKIDFPTDYNIELQCLKMEADNQEVDAYMAIIPGIVLAKIYKRYQQVLLEKNVRTFLQFKGKVNKGIRKTLREKPDMFFSYNNGISTTASGVETREIDGATYITFIDNWQIVNGGQTTASIAASLSDKTVDLSRVYVPMKISVVRDTGEGEDVVKAISTFANSQTAIKNSDFTSNDPYLIDLENISRQEWVPNGKNKPECKWYFERTRGQYLDQLAQLNGINEKAFRKEYPKIQKFTKTDIARYELLWKQMPYNVCKGNEGNYALFVAEIKKERPVVTPQYYRHIIAKGLLYRTIDSIVSSKKLGGYKASVTSYLMAAVSFLSNAKLDLDSIWNNQKVQQAVVDRIEELVAIVWHHLTNSSVVSVLTWTKKAECWNRLKIKLGDFEKFDASLLQSEDSVQDSHLNEAQLGKIQLANSISSDEWFAIANWAKSMNLMSPLDRKTAFNLGTLRSRNQGVKSLKQALSALRIREEAIELGFKK